MDQITTLTMRCSKCGALAVAACNCGEPYQYISPGELAAKAVKANPEKSDRAIAEDLGITHPTVAKARKATGKNLPVDEKRTGRDGKKRRMSRRGKTRIDPAIETEAVRLLFAQGKGRKEVARELGLRENAVQLIMNREFGRQQAEPIIDPKSLSISAQKKLALAIRQHQRKLDVDFEQRVQSEVTKRFDKAFPSLQQEQNAAYDREKTYRQFMEQQKKIYSMQDYNTILMCLHPDGERSEYKLTAAFRLFRAKKFALTGEK